MSNGIALVVIRFELADSSSETSLFYCGKLFQHMSVIQSDGVRDRGACSDDLKW